MTNPTDRPQPAITPTPEELARLVGGELREAAAAPERIKGMATLADAGPADLSFLGNDKLAAEAAGSAAGLLLVSPKAPIEGRACIVVDQVWPAVAAVLRALYPEPEAPAGVHEKAVVDESARLGPGVSVGPYAVIEAGAELAAGVVVGPHSIVGAGCVVGEATRLVARVTLIGGTRVGRRCLIHPGAVLGADGFKFELVQGRFVKIPQVGRVVIEDDVEIGANTTVDRAFLNQTRVGEGTKVDNLCQIAHNVQVGPHCVMAAHVGIAGSTKVGSHCMMGGRVGLADNITVGDRVIIGATSGVPSDVPSDSQIIGAPAMKMRDFWRMTAAQQKLPELMRRLRDVEKKIEQPSGEG